MKQHILTALAVTFWFSGAPAQSLTGSGTVRFFDRAYETNDVLFCDSLLLEMTNVSDPDVGMEYHAWLIHDTGSYHTLGLLTVASGAIDFGFAESSQNLVQHHRGFLITQEVVGFSGTQPTTASIRFRGHLYDGSGSPGSANALTYVRNVIGSFQTPTNLGLMSQMVRQLFKTDNLVQHATLATVQTTDSNVKVHTNHSYDFVTGTPDPRVTSGSVANNGDPLGYGMRRYADFDTTYSSPGGAGYHIPLALDQPDASQSMMSAGQATLATLQRTFGADNASGIAKQFTDKCLEIIGKSYATVGPAVTDAVIMKNLAQTMQDSILVAYRHALDMATIAVETVDTPTGVPDREVPEQFSLEQNYPNPFNPETKIEFMMKDRGHVKVSAYDGLGRLVRVIAEQHMEPGVHSVTWDASGLPSGVYLFRMVVSGERGEVFRATRRGILLK